MFNKEEAEKIRQEFWTSFGKSFPRKWILYNTQIKGLRLKFVADRKKALVTLDLEHPDQIANDLIYDQLLSLKTILQNEYLPDVSYDPKYELDSGKKIQRIYSSYPEKFSIYNRKSWNGCYQFYLKKMLLFESFFLEYQELLRQAIL